MATLATLAASAVVGCAPKRSPPLRPGQAQVVLLPDPGDAGVGGAVVSNPAGGVELSAARESTTASSGQPPAPVTVLSEADTNRLFGDVLSTLPPAPQRFVLYFRFESDDLTDESRALVPRVLEALRSARSRRRDRAHGYDGDAASNVELPQARQCDSCPARSGGYQPDVIETSHGEADRWSRPPTAPEPRNRRVEITVDERSRTPCRPRVRYGAGGAGRAAVAVPPRSSTS
jgi:hypothetical protein